jgi:hypothetical protein
MLSMVLCLSAVIRENTKMHMEALIKEKNHLVSKCKAIEQGIKPMLDLIGMEPEEAPSDRPARPEAIVEKCQSSWIWFKQYIRDAGEYVGTHVLGVVQSHYPGVDLKRLETGVSNNTDQRKAEQLRITSMETVSKMIADVDLFFCSGSSVEAPKVVDMPRIWDVDSVEITQPIRGRPSDRLDHVRALPMQC